jgi:hypothetical protein
MMPMIPSQMRPSTAKPTTVRISQRTSRTTIDAMG